MDLEKVLASLQSTSRVQTPSKLPQAIGCCTEEEMYGILSRLYQIRVEERGVEFINDADTKARIQKVSKWLCKQTMPGLLLYGKCGTGKTVMAKAISNIIFNGRPRGQAIIMTANDIHDAFKENRYEYSVFRTAAAAIIDDLGCEPLRCNVFGIDYEPIRTILYDRYDRQLISVITTNLDDEMVKDRYGERVWGRICETFDRIVYTSTDYRE